MVKAYRDTWTLEIHSYLAYLRDRLAMARKLPADTGSIFVQIGDENQHRVRCLIDEVFGTANFVCNIYFRKKTMPLGGAFLERMGDYLLWYAKDIKQAEKKLRRLFVKHDVGGDFHWTNFGSSRISVKSVWRFTLHANPR